MECISFCGYCNKLSKTWWHKPTDSFSHRPGGQKSKVKLAVWSPSTESLGVSLSFPSSSFWWLLAFLDLLAYDYKFPISASIFTSPFHVSVGLLVCLLQGCRSRAYPGDAGWCHINNLNLIAFAKILFPSEVATSGFRNLDVDISFGGGTRFNPLQNINILFFMVKLKNVCVYSVLSDSLWSLRL